MYHFDTSFLAVPSIVPFSNPQFLHDLEIIWELRHLIPNPREFKYATQHVHK